MFDALARLADGRARRSALLAVAFFLLAGALGGSVADRLDPYGADDPATETVQATRAARGRRPARPGGDRRRRGRAGRRARRPGPGSRRSSASCATAPTSQSVTGYYDTRSRDFVSNDGDSTYLAVALKPTDDKEWQEAGADDRRPARRPARASSSAAPRSPRSRSTSRSRRTCERPRCSPSRCSSCSRCSSSAASSRRCCR